MTLETELKKLLADFEGYRDEYKSAQEDPKLDPDRNGHIFRGKYEAYTFASNRLRRLLQWHGVIES